MASAYDIPPLRAGDQAQWSFDATQFAGKALRYLLAGPQALQIPVPADGSVSLSSLTTSTYTPGGYVWYLVAEEGSERITVDTGTVDVLPDITAVSTPIDTRTHAKRLVDAIEATLEGRVTADVQQLSIRGRSISKIPVAELLVLRDKYKAEIARDDAAAGISTARNKVFVRFSR